MMMNRKRSSTVHLSKYAFILPVVLAGSLIFGLSHAGQKEPLPSEADGKMNKVVVSKVDRQQNNEVVSEVAPKQDKLILSEPILSEIDRKQDTLKKKTVKKHIVITGGKSDTSKHKPLYVLNGVILTGSLDQINPEDIEKMEVLKGESAKALYGEKGKHGVILVTTKGGAKQPGSNTVRIEGTDNKAASRLNLNGKKPLIIVDGVKVDDVSLSDMDPKTIKSIAVLKDENAIKKYGEEAKDGVIRITTHQGASTTSP